MFKNEGHGHVYPRPDGVRARCGGPGVCAECSKDQSRYDFEVRPAGCGYGDGGYSRLCRRCNKHYIGAKRSWNCKSCAEKVMRDNETQEAAAEKFADLKPGETLLPAEELARLHGEIANMKRAALTLYISGRWFREGPSPDDDAAVWERFRDAFGIPKGLATSLGVNGK